MQNELSHSNEFYSVSQSLAVTLWQWQFGANNHISKYVTAEGMIELTKPQGMDILYFWSQQSRNFSATKSWNEQQPVKQSSVPNSRCQWSYAAVHHRCWVEPKQLASYCDKFVFYYIIRYLHRNKSGLELAHRSEMVSASLCQIACASSGSGSLRISAFSSDDRSRGGISIEMYLNGKQTDVI